MKQSLLIADSDAELRNHYEISLMEHGYEAETASDGLDCLRKLRQGMPAALLLDLELRWGGGDGVLAWLREERHDISVVLTVPAEYPQGFARFIKPPVVACLRKPFAVAILLESVRSRVAKERRREPLNRHRFPTYSEHRMEGKKELWMAGPTALPDRPLHKHAGEGTDALQTTTSLRAQSLEDRCLAERIVRALHATGYGGLRNVEVRVNSRTVHLVGRVHSYHLKQIAQVTVLAVSGTHQIHNDLEVIIHNDLEAI